eukprot:10781104-Alexandrium_andersonii.AAC.1
MLRPGEDPAGRPASDGRHLDLRCPGMQVRLDVHDVDVDSQFACGVRCPDAEATRRDDSQRSELNTDSIRFSDLFLRFQQLMMILVCLAGGGA